MLQFLKKNTNTSPPDFSPLEVDFHSHLIPGLDDGVDSFEESIEIIKALHDLGYQKIITTPHINTEMFNNTPTLIQNGRDQLKKEVEKEGINIKIEAAAEYYINYDFLTNISKSPLLTLDNKYLLIEFSFYNPPTAIENIIFELQSTGYNLILVHPERYLFWFNDLQKFRNIHNRDVYFQLNIPSFANHYGRGPKKLAEKLVKHQLVDFLGSDAHNMKHIQALKAAFKNKKFQQLIYSGMLKNNRLNT